MTRIFAFLWAAIGALLSAPALLITAAIAALGEIAFPSPAPRFVTPTPRSIFDTRRMGLA